MSGLTFVYKYMPFREEFFDNFFLRCSQKSALNDPFEMGLDSETFYKMVARKKLPHIGKSEEEVKKKLHSSRHDYLIQYRGVVEEDIGVMSFTKRPDNLLMWSHYGDDGKGLVIKFDATHQFFTPKKMVESEISKLFSIIKPEASTESTLLDVKYSDKRGHTLKDKAEITLNDVFLEKSKYWEYEEEVRLFRSLTNANEAFLSDHNLMEVAGEYTPQDIITKTSKDKWKISPSTGSLPLYFTSPKAYYFYKMPVDSIISVICGPRMSPQDRDFVRKKCEEHKLKFIESSLDHQEYKLNFNPPN